MMEGGKERASRRATWKGQGTKERSLEERRRSSEALVRRQRGTALNAKRKLQLLELQKDVENGAPILFSEEETRVAIQSALCAIQSAKGGPERLRQIRYLRYLLTDSEDPPYVLFAELGTLQLFMSELASENAEVRSESLWALAVMADGHFMSAQTLLQQVSLFLPYLDGSPGYDVAELAAWLIRSLASEMTKEDEMASLDVAAPLVQLMFACTEVESGSDVHLLDASLTAAWALCSLVAHSPSSRLRLLTFPHFSTRLSELLASENGRLVMEAAWLIAYLVAVDDAHLAALIQANVVSQLVKVLKLFLAEPDPDLSTVHGVLTPVLRSLGNIAAGISPEQVLELIQHDNGVILKCMSECLQCNHRGIQKEACNALSNIAAACDSPTMEVFAASPVLEQIIHLVGQSAFDIKRAAAFVLANICFNSAMPNVEFLKFVISKEHQIVPGIVSLMRGIDVETIKLGLDFTQLILENVSDGAQRLEEADGIDALDNLQFGEIPPELQDLASYLVDTYYGEDYGLD